MRYQISYYSPMSHAERLADAFSRFLPMDTAVVNLREESVICGDVHLVGFEVDGKNAGAIPYKVMEFVEQLEGKTLFLFTTSPLFTSEKMRQRNENTMRAFLPNDCDYRGLYMCPGQASEQMIHDLEEVVELYPDEEWASVWLTQCHNSYGHPGQEDILQGCRVMLEALGLNKI